eukprot:TRINITY_DN172_c3_g1_i3.p1 TRINITY_DN172_c3_g1~~TRINITY_DN172_c3_g1_i3.p1  ORF type:complete len:648 (+),score=203.34 TRINITY_DN172_c3_g1_i3:57-2000(+)
MATTPPASPAMRMASSPSMNLAGILSFSPPLAADPLADTPLHAKLLEETAFADVQFVLPGKGGQLTAHSSVLRCRWGEALLPEEKKKSKDKDKPKVVKLKQGDILAERNVLPNILYFLYTGVVPLEELFKGGPRDILQLRAGAETYKLPRLVFLCEDFFRRRITLDNLCPILKEANDLNAQPVKEMCIKFALANFKVFVANKEWNKYLGSNLFQEVVVKYTEIQEARSSGDDASAQELSRVGSERTVNPPNTIIADFKQLYEDASREGDVKLMIEGKLLSCHKFMLAAYSEIFSKIFIDANKSKKEKPVESANISADAFVSLLKYVYYRDVAIEPIPAAELITFSHKYLPSLHKDMVELCGDIIRGGINHKSVVPILAVTYQPFIQERKREDLKRMCLDYVSTHLEEIDLAPLRGIIHGKPTPTPVTAPSSPGPVSSSSSSSLQTPASPGSSSSNLSPVAPIIDIALDILISTQDRLRKGWVRVQGSGSRTSMLLAQQAATTSPTLERRGTRPQPDPVHSILPPMVLSESGDKLKPADNEPTPATPTPSVDHHAPAHEAPAPNHVAPAHDAPPSHHDGEANHPAETHKEAEHGKPEEKLERVPSVSELVAADEKASESAPNSNPDHTSSTPDEAAPHTHTTEPVPSS